MLSLSIVGWIVVGGFAGWIAGIVVPSERRGCLINVAVGVVGGLVGGAIFTALGVSVKGGPFLSFAVALIGAVVFLLILRAISGPRRPSE